MPELALGTRARRHNGVRAWLWSLLRSEDEPVVQAAATALLRLGDDRPLSFMQTRQSHNPGRGALLAIGGGPDALHVLLDVIRGGRADCDAVLGLGLVGDLGAVAPLLELLEDEASSSSAAVALNTITGAESSGHGVHPRHFDPDELLDSEREAFERDGIVPTRNGEPYGNWQRRALRDKAEWRSWLEQNRHHLSRESDGGSAAHSPDALFDGLARHQPILDSIGDLRRARGRYGLDLPFELELSVSQQRRFLENIQAWVHRESDLFTPGRWYFARELRAEDRSTVTRKTRCGSRPGDRTEACSSTARSPEPSDIRRSR